MPLNMTNYNKKKHTKTVFIVNYNFAVGGFIFFMNTNEECLLLFLKNPGRIDNTTDKLISSVKMFSNPFIREKQHVFIPIEKKSH